MQAGPANPDRLVGYKISRCSGNRCGRGISRPGADSRASADRGTQREVLGSRLKNTGRSRQSSKARASSISARLVKFKARTWKSGTRLRPITFSTFVRKSDFSSTPSSPREEANLVPPFTTSKLQQDAARGWLHRQEDHDGRQKLYEASKLAARKARWLISYMRTDRRAFPTRRCKWCGRCVRRLRPELPAEKPVFYKSKKDAQDPMRPFVHLVAGRRRPETLC